VRTTTTATGKIMIAGEGMEIMMTEGMSITSRRRGRTSFIRVRSGANQKGKTWNQRPIFGA